MILMVYQIRTSSQLYRWITNGVAFIDAVSGAWSYTLKMIRTSMEQIHLRLTVTDDAGNAETSTEDITRHCYSSK